MVHLRPLLVGFAFVLCLPVAVCGRTGHAAGDAWLDALAARARARWEVPGMAVAVVRGRNIVARAYGVRDVATGRPVTNTTLFAAGSIAKSFTAIGLAMLVAEGRLGWDTPVRRILPTFRLRRLSGGRPVNIRDLLAHRSGLPRHDALWYLRAFASGELIRRLHFLAPYAQPGVSFQYSNLMVMVAGHLAGRAVGSGWKALTRQRILLPLGLEGIRLSLKDFIAATDRAQGYFPAAEGRIPIVARDTDAIAPAAAVYANLGDMVRWLRFLIAGGDLDGKRLLPRPAFDALLAPTTEIPDPPDDAAFGRAFYSLGFYVTRYRNRRLVRHPGVIDGYAALLSFMPDTGQGVVVLTNLSGDNPAPAVMTYGIYDRLLGLDPVSWIERYPSAAERRAARPAGRSPDPPTAKPASSPSRPIAVYAGTYAHPAYGEMRIVPASGGDLWGRFHALAFRLRHAGGEIWRLSETHWPLRAGLAFRFEAGDDGRIARLATPLADGPTYRHNPGELFFERISARPGVAGKPQKN